MSTVATLCLAVYGVCILQPRRLLALSVPGRGRGGESGREIRGNKRKV